MKRKCGVCDSRLKENKTYSNVFNKHIVLKCLKCSKEYNYSNLERADCLKHYREIFIGGMIAFAFILLLAVYKMKRISGLGPFGAIGILFILVLIGMALEEYRKCKTNEWIVESEKSDSKDL